LFRSPALYVQLIAKTMPASVAVEITAHVLNLGEAMRDAQSRLEVYQSTLIDPPMIDITPTDQDT